MEWYPQVMDEERTLWEGTPSQIINLPLFILCALLAGALIGAGWAPREIFYAAAIPAAISAVTMFSLRWVMKPERPAMTETQVLAH